MKADIYKYLSTADGYLVYRALVSKPHIPLEDVARAHKVAVFVDESEARDYCRYRNELIDQRGTDEMFDVPLLPCPVCGSEAVGHQDVLSRVIIRAASGV